MLPQLTFLYLVSIFVWTLKVKIFPIRFTIDLLINWNKMILIRLIKLLLPSSSTGTSTSTSPDYSGSNGLSSTSDYEDFSLDSILQGNPLVLRFISWEFSDQIRSWEVNSVQWKVIWNCSLFQGSPSGCGSPSPSITSSSSSSLSPMNSPEENLRPFFSEHDVNSFGLKLRRMSSLVWRPSF